ncbi:hypothetical protein BVG19_g2811 [[Candida] boidinii]|nr:hypothetical protein BVG19_g2811 [[Candida] boidinii]OWB52988.1 hypothetical protein B5S27_g4573 [[Candida] boidinii]
MNVKENISAGGDGNNYSSLDLQGEEKFGKSFENLIEIFPNIPIDAVIETLTTACGDESAAFDLLLNYDLIKILDETQISSNTGYNKGGIDTADEKDWEWYKKEKKQPSFSSSKNIKSKKSIYSTEKSDFKCKDNINSDKETDEDSLNTKMSLKFMSDIDELMNQLDIDFIDIEELTYIYCKNNKNLTETLVDIIENKRFLKLKQDSPKILSPKLDNNNISNNNLQTQNQTKTRKTSNSSSNSKVQGAYTTIKPMYNRDNNTTSNDISKIRELLKDTENVDDKRQQSTTFAEVLKSKDSKINKENLNRLNEAKRELTVIKNSNKSLYKIPNEFYISLLEYFEFDISKVINICFKILQDKKTLKELQKYNKELLFSNLEKKFEVDLIGSNDNVNEDDGDDGEFEYTKTKESSFKIDDKKTVEKLFKEAKRLRNESDSIASVYYTDEAKKVFNLAKEKFEKNQINKMQKIENEGIRTNVIDLHELTVSQARSLCEKFVNDWWNEELRERELNGNSSKISKTIYLQPITIATGRGLHSAGGIPKIRIAIAKYLDSAGYRYTETGSTIIVSGKR